MAADCMDWISVKTGFHGVSCFLGKDPYFPSNFTLKSSGFSAKLSIRSILDSESGILKNETHASLQ